MSSVTGRATLGGVMSTAASAVRQATPIEPLIGVVLGSGLGAFAEALSERVELPYAAIPGMPVSKVLGHEGNLCLGRISGVPVACLQGRVHLYEGHTPERVVFGVRLLAELGCRAVLLTNAAGGIAPTLSAGSFMLIVDHLNLTGHNPLVGEHDPSLGARFVDLSRAYDETLCEAARRAAADLGIAITEGVYAAMLGPSYETPAEIRMLRALGADAVGMSTVPEVIALRQRGVRVGAISCITNVAAGLNNKILDHEEVKRVAESVRQPFSDLIARFIPYAAQTVAEPT